MEKEKKHNFPICPYLGSRSDPVTALAYPSMENYCFHAMHGAGIKMEHQEAFCLTIKYLDCKEYSKEPGVPLPDEKYHLQGRKQNRKGRNHIYWWIIVLVGLGAIAAWQYLTRWAIPDRPLDLPTEVIQETLTRAELVIPTASSTNTRTIAPTLADTATVMSLLGLETPLGIDHNFIIHKIQTGESLELIAGKFGTTAGALIACNYRLPVPLVTGLTIVIPLSFTDEQGFPAFEVYSVTEEITPEDLSIRLGVDLDQFTYYNGFIPDFRLRAGDWVLVPRMGTPTP